MQPKLDFEVFTEWGQSFQVTVSITKGGLISFNKGSVHRYNISAYKYVILSYAKDERMIGIRLTNRDDTLAARKLRHRKSGADILAKPFLDFYQIDYASGTKRYDLKQSENRDTQGMLVIDLKKERSTRKSGGT